MPEGNPSGEEPLFVPDSLVEEHGSLEARIALAMDKITPEVYADFAEDYEIARAAIDASKKAADDNK